MNRGLDIFKRFQWGTNEVPPEPDEYGPGWSMQRALHSAKQYIPEGATWLGHEIMQGIMPDEAVEAIRRDPTSMESLMSYAMAGINLSGGKGRHQTPFGPKGAVPFKTWASWKEVSPGNYTPGQVKGQIKVDPAGNYYEQVGGHGTAGGETEGGPYKTGEAHIIAKPIGKPGSAEAFYQQHQEQMATPPDKLTNPLHQQMQELEARQDIASAIDQGKKGMKDPALMQDFMDSVNTMTKAYPKEVLGAQFNPPQELGGKLPPKGAPEITEGPYKGQKPFDPAESEAIDAYWKQFGEKHKDAQVPPEKPPGTKSFGDMTPEEKADLQKFHDEMAEKFPPDKSQEEPLGHGKTEDEITDEEMFDAMAGYKSPHEQPPPEEAKPHSQATWEQYEIDKAAWEAANGKAYDERAYGDPYLDPGEKPPEKIPFWHELSPEGQDKFFKEGGFKDKLEAAMNWDHIAGNPDVPPPNVPPKEPPFNLDDLEPPPPTPRFQRGVVSVEKGYGPRHAFNAQEGTENVPRYRDSLFFEPDRTPSSKALSRLYDPGVPEDEDEGYNAAFEEAERALGPEADEDDIYAATMERRRRTAYKTIGVEINGEEVEIPIWDEDMTPEQAEDAARDRLELGLSPFASDMEVEAAIEANAKPRGYAEGTNNVWFNPNPFVKPNVSGPNTGVPTQQNISRIFNFLGNLAFPGLGTLLTGPAATSITRMIQNMINNGASQQEVAQALQQAQQNQGQSKPDDTRDATGDPYGLHDAPGVTTPAPSGPNTTTNVGGTGSSGFGGTVTDFSTAIGWRSNYGGGIGAGDVSRFGGQAGSSRPFTEEQYNTSPTHFGWGQGPDYGNIPGATPRASYEQYLEMFHVPGTEGSSTGPGGHARFGIGSPQGGAKTAYHHTPKTSPFAMGTSNVGLKIYHRKQLKKPKP